MVLAREQTAGRGRRGRNFQSTKDLGMYLSVLLRPKQDMEVSSALYPKHVKVNTRSFFIAIKTTANTLEEFKTKGANQVKTEKPAQKETQSQYTKSQPGWYEARLVFKRVISLPETQKSHYIDTTFACKVKADSVQECYNKVIAHLRGRQDIDVRSQFPSIKSQNFAYNYLGN